jgi:hypothetical protein
MRAKTETRSASAKRRESDRRRQAHRRSSPESREGHRRAESFRRRYSRERYLALFAKCAILKKRLAFVQSSRQYLKEQVHVLQELVSNLSKPRLPPVDIGAQDFPNDVSARADQQHTWRTLPFAQAVLDNESTCKRVLHMTKNDFFVLCDEFREILQHTSLNGEPLKRKTDSKVPIEQQMFATLIFFSMYPPQPVLGAILGENARTIIKWIHHVTSVVGPLLAQKEVQWPCGDEWERQTQLWAPIANQVLPGAACAIDGTEVEISMPSKPHALPNRPNKQQTFSVKKHQHSLSFQVICLFDGTIVYVSPGEEKHNDQQQFNDLGIRKLFEGKTFGFVADGGYHPNNKKILLNSSAVIAKTPHRRHSKKVNGKKVKTPLTEEQKAENRKLSQLRVVVENVNAQLKKWAILAGKFRHYNRKQAKADIINVNNVFNMIAALTNRRNKINPLRKVETFQFKPKKAPLQQPEAPDAPPAPKKKRGLSHCSGCGLVGHRRPQCPKAGNSNRAQ